MENIRGLIIKWRISSTSMDISCRFLGGSSTEIKAMLTIAIPDQKEGQAAVPLDIVVVVDESSSMEVYFPMVKSVLRFLTSHVPPETELGIVGFSENGVVRCPLTNTTDPRLFVYIDTIQTRTLTNLGAGLTTGVELLGTQGRADAFKVLLLITDGMANVGLVDEGALQDHVRSMLPTGACMLSMAIGMECNHDLLTSMALATNGKAMRVDAAEDIAAVGGSLLGSVLATSFRQVSIESPMGTKNVSGLPEDGETGDILLHNLGVGECVHVPVIFSGELRGVFTIRAFQQPDRVFRVELPLDTLCWDWEVETQFVRAELGMALATRFPDHVVLQALLVRVQALPASTLQTLLLQRVYEGLERQVQTEEQSMLSRLELIRQSSQSSDADHPMCLPLMREWSRSATEYCTESYCSPPQDVQQDRDLAEDVALPSLRPLRLVRSNRVYFHDDDSVWLQNSVR
jgi:hypothetical protein